MDINCEDWRTRENMWNQTRYALEFFHDYLPFAEMVSQVPGDAREVDVLVNQSLRVLVLMFLESAERQFENTKALINKYGGPESARAIGDREEP